MVQMDPDALEAGRDLAHPPPGEEVVISGCSGAFPDSDSVAEFADKLFNKEDCISGDGRRWILDHPEIPQRTGKLNKISKFDAGYFGIHYKQAQAMDPMCRMVLEKAAEAVFDAGYNPQSLFGKRVGVFVGACFSETEKTWFYEKLQVNGFGVTGCARTMLANRISYWLGVKGPSYTIDTACSSSLYAMEHGYRSIREGLCDAAIVAGTNLCLHPYVSLQFSRLGVLSKDGKCKCFDESANGYCRSEAISAVLLQKKKDARRIYATVIHAKTNCDGYKEEGITFPSGPLQQSLLEEFYAECQINPWDLAWVEAHGTGTKVGDPEEVKAIENVFCVNRKEPLKIGSLKSNTGHTEPASGLLSITKVIIAMETGFIPPNINYTEPRKDIDALHNGKIMIVTEKTPWEGGLVGVNSFGFGGANCHVLLKWNEKSKINKGLPNDNLPRLVYLSGRTHEAIDNILKFMEDNPLDVDFIKLFHTIYKDEVPGHLYRGYAILTKSGPLAREIRECPTLKQPFWYAFPGLGFQWKESLEQLKKLPMFAQIFMECSNVLKKQNVDLVSIVNAKEKTTAAYKTVLMNCVTQIIFVKIMKNLGFEPDNIIGTSFGEIACAYADGSLTFEHALITTYYVSKAVSQLENHRGATAFIGLPQSAVKSLSSSGISYVFSGETCTIISGPDVEVSAAVETAKRTKSVEAKVLLGVALHSPNVTTIKTTLQQQLQKVIIENRVSSPKWLSTSSKDKNKQTNFNVSAEYFCNNLFSPIHFEEWFNSVERYSAVIEMAPEPIFGRMLNKNTIRKKLAFVQMLSGNQDKIVSFMGSLGKIANLGANFDLALLYPTVEFPVARSTPMISPLIKWDHETDWYVTSYKTQDRITTGERFITLSLKDEEQEYISGHVIDGRNLFPATGYLFLVWESIALMNAQLHGEVSVVFENVRFNRATNMPKDGGTIDFTVTIQRSSGFFEVMESGATIVTGRVYIPEDAEKESSNYNCSSTATMDDSVFVLKSKDLYKELRLRGYNYKGLFRSVLCCNLDGSQGFIKWQNNYVAFMDNMLQLQILNTDSRALFVPTGLSRVVIDVKKHARIISELDEDNKVLPVFNNKYVQMIKSGGIEIRGMNASAISRRKPLSEPVLENFQFLPYHPAKEIMDLNSITRLFIHIVLENNPSISVKVFEMGELKSYENYMANSIISALAALPLIQPDVTIYNAVADKVGEDRPAELSTEEKKMPNEQSALISVGCDLLDPENDQALQACIGAVKETGFIISRDQSHQEVTTNGLIKCSSVCFENTYYTLLRKVKTGAKKITSIRVDNNDLSWIKPLQEALKSDEYKKVLIYSEKQEDNGILGLVNCILKEGHIEKARCFFILDPRAAPFSQEDPFYANQIDKDLAVNIYKNGEWGSYRHLLLDPSLDVMSHHGYISFQTKGDVSSLIWAEGELSKRMKANPDMNVHHVYYSALNFRDVMTATGKLAAEVVQPNRLLQDSVQGLEFSGRDSSGRRIMGITGSKGIATVVDPSVSLVWEVPAEWSLEEAATIPCVYATIVYAFCLAGHPKKGDTILIHAGTGGIGQAAINYCLFYGCKIFTTVGTPEKREFIKKTFPQLTDNQIGNSRDTSFEQLIMRETDGRGVDFVINSLAEEKLLASVRCLARGGRFLELGKFDMANDNPLGMDFLLKEASFHGIMLNVSYDGGNKWRDILFDLVESSLKKGAIKPFSRHVFGQDEVENALRFMAAGKHMGKVLIKIRDEESQIAAIPKPITIKAKPKYYCDPEKSYIILGGLGGFGLELTDWLILRGARKVVLSSRTGVKDGYQAMRISVWETYNVKVEVFTDDVTTEEGVIALLNTSNEIGPVGGIFNLAVVLRDALFDNQTEEDFKISLKPKAIATALLDNQSRKLCPQLDDFVIFSSVSCGRGNAGQTNYGMSNSIMERICEQRVKDGYPGLAIQWGAVGDVGLVANMQEENTQIVIGGTLPQKIDSCLSVMDRFLNDKHPVVASMVVAEKKYGSGGAGNMMDAVLNIIGLRDLKSISMHSTLAELGMDSMMAVEIKQTLEREFEVFLTPQDIRGMTFAKLQDIANAKSQGGDSNKETKSDALPEGLQVLIRFVADEATASIPVIKLESLYKSEKENNFADRLIFLPGIEGFAAVFQKLCLNLNSECYCVQYDFMTIQSTIREIAEIVVKRMEGYISKEYPVRLVAYSFGGIVSLEVVEILEKMGYQTFIYIIDGSPDLMRHLVNNSLDTSNEVLSQIGVLLGFVDLLWPQDKTKLEPVLLKANNWDERMDVIINATNKNVNFKEVYKKAFITSIYKRLLAVSSYHREQDNSLFAPLTLLRPATNMMVDYEEDYGLSRYTKNEVDVHVIEGNHITILENIKTADIINGIDNVTTS